MLAEKYRLWSREGGPFDIIAIAVSLIVIVGGFFVFNSRSMEFRTSGQPLASALPVVAPLALPSDETPRQ